MTLNIVFDIGGVVVTWQPQLIVARVFPDPDVQALVLTQIVGHADWIEMDRGNMGRELVIARAVGRTGLSEAEVDKFLRRVPLELVAIPETVALLFRLKSLGHNLYCLSNMAVDFLEHLEKTYTFWEVFKATVFSCHLHLCKPEPAIYSYLLETYGLAGNETIFIDDTEVNLSVAAQFGITTVKFESPAQCESRLQTLGCL